MSECTYNIPTKDIDNKNCKDENASKKLTVLFPKAQVQF